MDEHVRETEKKAAGMADIEMIETLREAEKTNKANFLQEFERF